MSEASAVKKSSGLRLGLAQVAKTSLQVFIVEASSEKALKCRFVNGDVHWVPHSQIDDESDCHHEGDEGSLIVPLWLANKLFPKLWERI